MITENVNNWKMSHTDVACKTHTDATKKTHTVKQVHAVPVSMYHHAIRNFLSNLLEHFGTFFFSSVIQHNCYKYNLTAIATYV